MRAIALAIVAGLLCAGAPAPTIGPDLAQLRAFAKRGGDTLWPGYGAAPFGFLLITADREVLLCEDRVPAGFTPGAIDAATRCGTADRPRGSLPAGLLAAMPLFGPPSTIVMGTPGATGRTREAWLRTILHEHFHQWQTVLPGYWTRVAALDLAKGDQTGMWMLNYAFPYAEPKVVAAHAAASRALAAALGARGTRGFGAALDRYMSARRAFAASVSPADWRYAEFQLWQEGTARWTEIALGKRYPDATVRSAAAALERDTLDEIARTDLAGSGRLFAYPYGAGEAMLLDACGPGWRAKYPETMALGPLLKDAASRCGSRPR